MGIASLALALIAVVFAILPLVFTQLVGLVLGIVALILGVWGRRQLGEQGRSTTVATTGLTLGILAALLSGLIYGTFIYGAQQPGDELVRGGDLWLERELGGREFRKTLERAIERLKE